MTATLSNDDINGTKDAKIEDADPDKFLVLYSVKNEIVDGKEKNTITKYDIISLKDDSGSKNALLQYPCSIIVNIDSGNGEIGYESKQLQKTPISETADYDSTVNIVFVPAEGYSLDKVIVTNPEDSSDEILSSGDFVTIGSYKGITLSNVHHDYRIKAQFVINP